MQVALCLPADTENAGLQVRLKDWSVHQLDGEVAAGGSHAARMF